MSASIQPAAEAAKTRSCGDCTLCCKVYEVPVLSKPRNKWCSNCKPGQGCGIWQSRPQFCRDFLCMWVQDTRLEEEWKPSRSKFVMAWAGSHQLNITCDPGSPMAHRKEPFWTALKDTSARFAADGKVIVVYTGDQKFVLLPDGERLLGPRDLFIEFRVVTEDRFGVKSYFVEARNPDGSVRRIA